jgi:hypothetical protein
MTKDEALDLALEALELLTDTEQTYDALDLGDKAITAIKQARSAPVQEPVAWQVMVEDEAIKEFSVKDAAHDWCVLQKLAGSPYSYWIRPLYTKPPAQEFVCSTGLCHYKSQREWVGLTDEEIEAIHQNTWMQSTATLNDFARAIEAKLKEKNT